MADIGAMLEAERRGILTPELTALLNEGRRRGLVPIPQEAPTPEPIGIGQPLQGPPSLDTQAKEVFGLDPSLDRAALLPAAVNQQGNVEPAVPGVLYNILRSSLLPGRVSQGGDFTPEDVTNLALDVGVPLTARGVTGPVAPVARMTRRQLIESAPSPEDLKGAATKSLDRAVSSGINVNPDRYVDLLADFETIGGMNRVDPTLHPGSSAVLKSLEKTLGESPDVQDLNISRRLIGVAQRSTQPELVDDRRIAGLLEDRLDDFVDNLSADDVLSGNPEIVGPNLRDFRTNWSRAKKSELIGDIIQKAENSASGFHNGLRVGFRSLLNNKKQLRGFSQEEQQLIRDVATGKGTNLSRIVGQFGISDRGTGALGVSLGAGVGAFFGGPLGAVAAPVVGTLARLISSNQALERANAARAAAATGQIPESSRVMQRLLRQALEKATTPVGTAQNRKYPEGFI